MIIGHWHTGLAVKDIDTSIAFYEGVLGFTLTDKRIAPSGNSLAFLEKCGYTFELIQRKSGINITAEEGDKVHFAFEVDDLDATVKDLREKNVVFLKEPSIGMDGTAKIVFFAGPDGEQIELMEILK